VLGGLLLENGAWDQLGDLLTDGDFYRYEHRLIAEIGGLVNATRPADVITVYEHLQRLGKAEEVGGLAYLNALAQYVTSASNIRRYAEIVRERSILRKRWPPRTRSPPAPSIRKAGRWIRSWTRPSRRSSTSAKKARG
jgi:replicative DNA helicase